VFFFAKVNIFGWFRTLLKVLLIFSAFLMFIAVINGVQHLLKQTRHFIFGGGWKGGARKNKNNQHKEKKQVGLDIKFTLGNVLCSGVLILFIIAVEMTIKWNQISAVGVIAGTGQLLPMIIGIAGLGRVAMRFAGRALEDVALKKDANNTATTPGYYTGPYAHWINPR